MDEALVRHGAPTLAGLKCGSLFDLPYGSRRALGLALAGENARLGPRGLRLAPLRVRRERTLLLLYRRRELEELLLGEAGGFFQRLGYAGTGLEPCLQELRRRLAGSGPFPHEVGLLLGYPLEDVAGFLADQGGRRSKCTGCWKVYGDEAAARQRFAMYRTCTLAYYTLYRNGRTLEELTVPA